MTLGGRTLFRNLDLTLSPGVRIGLVGANGSGKTTLLKILEGELEPDRGHGAAGGRAAHRELRAGSHRASGSGRQPAPHALPGRRFGDLPRPRRSTSRDGRSGSCSRNEQLEMPVSSLSGGERARVLIALLMLRTADVLLLDEPTNDLDIPTLEVLEESLLDFPGALVLVSHDRYLLDRVSTTVIGLNPGGEARRVRRLFAVGSRARRAGATGGEGGAGDARARAGRSEEEALLHRAARVERRWKRRSSKPKRNWRRGIAKCRTRRRMRSGCPKPTSGCRTPNAAWTSCTRAGRSWNRRSRSRRIVTSL